MSKLPFVDWGAVALSVAIVVWCAIVIAAGNVDDRADAERRAFIASCEGNGGIAVVRAAGGVACAQPLGD